jgi:hypothetical protein
MPYDVNLPADTAPLEFDLISTLEYFRYDHQPVVWSIRVGSSSALPVLLTPGHRQHPQLVVRCRSKQFGPAGAAQPRFEISLVEDRRHPVVYGARQRVGIRDGNGARRHHSLSPTRRCILLITSHSRSSGAQEKGQEKPRGNLSVSPFLHRVRIASRRAAKARLRSSSILDRVTSRGAVTSWPRHGVTLASAINAKAAKDVLYITLSLDGSGDPDLSGAYSLGQGGDPDPSKSVR